MRPNFGTRRNVRRIAIAAVVLALVGGVGAAIVLRPKPVMDAWNKVRHHAPSSPGEAWATVRRHASDAWTTIRRHMPFDSSQAERTASVASATTVVADREASSARATKRAQKKKRNRSE